MSRRNFRFTDLSAQKDTFFREMRYRRMFESRLLGKCQYTGRVVKDSLLELDIMVKKIGKLNLNKDSKSTAIAKPSASEENTNEVSRASTPTSDISEKPEMIETTCTYSLALLVNDGTRFVSVRGALHADSLNNIITDKCRRRLNLPLLELDMPGPDSPEKTKILGKTILGFASYCNRKRIYTLDAFVVDKICPPSPSMVVHPWIKRQLDYFKLADPHFDFPGKIELVIGSDMHKLLIEGRPCFVISKSCGALQTLLGWVVGGKVPIDEHQRYKTVDDSADILKKTVRDVEDYVYNMQLMKRQGKFKKRNKRRNKNKNKSGSAN